MSHKSKYVTETGIDVVVNPTTGKEELKGDQSLIYVLSPDDSPTGAGKTISPKATVKMIKDQITENVVEIITRAENVTKKEDEIKQIIINEFSTKHIATEFGKESLLRLLAQEDCVGIRFTTCKSISGRSIIAVGLMEENNNNGAKISVPLKKEFYIDPELGQRGTATSEYAPLAEEEGVGLSTKKVLEDMGKNLADFVNELKLGERSSIENFSNKITTTFFGFQ
jgi:hypothetical protein